MIKGVIPWILRAESALNFIDTSILVFYHQGRQGRTDIRLQPRPAMAGSATSPTKNISRVPPPYYYGVSHRTCASHMDKKRKLIGYHPQPTAPLFVITINGFLRHVLNVEFLNCFRAYIRNTREPSCKKNNTIE